MNQAKVKQAQKQRRIKRVRAKAKGTAESPRLTVKRTLKHLYAQVIDDTRGRTLAAARDGELKVGGEKKSKLEIAAMVGRAVAEKALAKGVKRVVFDRRDKHYHGRVKAVADGAREGGLEF